MRAARIIGANQYKSHFLYDLIFNNLTNIDPKTISTDMHGVNKVNFALLYMFDRELSPRYTSISSRINSLHCFKNLGDYKTRDRRPGSHLETGVTLFDPIYPQNAVVMCIYSTFSLYIFRNSTSPTSLSSS